MTKIEVNGALLAYDDTGSGTPVVLLHAGIADRRMWREQVGPLAARHRVIALDLRGYGDSELPPTPFAHHDDVAGLLDALDLPGPPWSAARSAAPSPSTPRWPTRSG